MYIYICNKIMSVSFEKSYFAQNSKLKAFNILDYLSAWNKEIMWRQIIMIAHFKFVMNVDNL